jgi:predicted nucleotidyltransferase
MKEDFLKTRMQTLKSIFTKYEAKHVYLFGSAVSKEDYHDVDFLFSFDEEMDYELYANRYFALLNELETYLGTKVDLVAEKTIKNPYLRKSIEQQKICILP